MSRSIRPVNTINRATIGPLAKHHPNGVSLLQRVDSGPRLDDGWAKVQPAVVLSHPADWEKPGIETGPPGLQGIGYQRCNSLGCGRIPWL